MNFQQYSRLAGRLLACLLSGALALTGIAAPPMASGQTPAQEPAPAPIPPDQLDSLVAPIALYPDPLLAQVLAASTYPVEIVQLQQWLAKNPGLKDQALAEAVAKQTWDPSVQALAGLPDVLKRLGDDIEWTTDLGNAFLAQQQDVMNAVQRMRNKAKASGNLASNQQQVVQTKTVDTEQVIVIEQANPQVVYVPTYNPTVVYGPPVYPYPPIYYPPPGSLAISFGIGLAVGAAIGGGWGWGCGWGHNNTVVINNNNNFIHNTNVRTGNIGGGGGTQWQHNPQHRAGTPYPNRATASQFGGRQAGGNAEHSLGGGSANRGAGQGLGAGNAGGADHIGSRDLSGGLGAEGHGSAGAGGHGGLGGGAEGFSGSRASAMSNRGHYSMGGRGGGGRRR
jgi:hypothetical protein